MTGKELKSLFNAYGLIIKRKYEKTSFRIYKDEETKHRFFDWHYDTGSVYKFESEEYYNPKKNYWKMVGYRLKDPEDAAIFIHNYR